MAAYVAHNLRHLRVFQAVAQHRSVSRASVQSGVSQPAATQALAKLESVFAVPLFQRSHSGCYPTEFGTILLARVERHFAQIEQAILDVQPNQAKARAIASKITGTHLRCLVTIAEYGSMEPAAGVLGISVAALSRAARDLEKIIGRELFHRAAQGAALSKVGAEIARRFELAVREIELASEEIATAKGQSTASILIGALPMFPKPLIIASLNDLKAAHPGTRVKFVEGGYLSLLGDLRSGRLDFLFSVLRVPDWVKDVEEEPLVRAPFVIVARRGHPLFELKGITLDDLAHYEWVLPQPGTPRRMAFELLFKGYDPLPPAAVETHSIEFQRSVIANSDSLSFVTRQEALDGSELLAMVPFAQPVVRAPDGVATRSDWHPTAVQAVFLEHVRRNAKRLYANELPALMALPEREAEPALIAPARPRKKKRVALLGMPN